MFKKPYNKRRYPFLEACFSENPLPFKKLNRKGVKLNIASNKWGVSSTIKKIQKNIYKQESIPSVAKIQRQSLLRKGYKEESVTVSNVKEIHNFMKPSFQPTRRGIPQKLGLTKEKATIMDKWGRVSSLSFFVKSKYMFSLEQLKAEFSKKQSQYKKASHFKKLLEERKKLSYIYGCLGERQIQKYALQAKQLDGKFDENFIKIVESRLDVALFRICFFPTILSAKQWINHKNIRVNNCIVSFPGFQLKGGDIITISPEKKNVLKKKICFFIAEKMRIRSRHYYLRMDTFYTIIKNLILCQFSNISISSLNKGCTPSLEKKQNRPKERITANQGIIGGANTTKIQNICYFFKKGFYKIFKGIQGIQGVNRNKILRTLRLFPKLFSFPKYNEGEQGRALKVESSYKDYIQNFYPFLKVRNLFTSARPLSRRVAGLRISGMKPVNLEVCYKNMVAIFLYSPQKVALPAALDLHLIAKSF